MVGDGDEGVVGLGDLFGDECDVYLVWGVWVDCGWVDYVWGDEVVGYVGGYFF